MQLHERIAQARSEFERARSQLLDLKIALARFEAALLEVAAEELLRCWLESVPAEETIVKRIEAAIVHRADEPGQAVIRMLESLREELIGIIQAGGSEPRQPNSGVAEQANREIERELAPPRGRPAFDVNAAFPAWPDTLPPRMMPHWPIIARPLARSRLSGQNSTSLANQLTVHAEALYRWSIRYLGELTRRFDAAVATLEGAERFGSDPPLTTEMARMARRDLDRLRHWPADAA